MFYDDERTNFIEEQVERRKRDTKLARGRKGTLKIPLGQVVSDSDRTAVTRYDVMFYHFQPKCYGWKYLKALDALMDDKGRFLKIKSRNKTRQKMLRVFFSVDKIPRFLKPSPTDS